MVFNGQMEVKSLIEAVSVTFLVSSVFPVLCFLLYYLLWVSSFRDRIKGYKIRPDPVEPRQLRLEMIWTGLYPFFSTALVLGTTAFLNYFSLSKVYYNFSERSLAYYCLSFLAFVLLADFARYWCHRFMHTFPVLYENVHYLHHRSANVNPLSTLSMHPLDLLSGTPWLFATNFFPVHISVVVAFANFYHLQNLHRHFGYDFLGRDHFLSRVIISPRNHDLHHTEIGVNFGATLVLWDKLFGTYMSPQTNASKAI